MNVEEPTGNPCIPSPCGPNSHCKVVGSQAACSCLSNFIGRPPNCRPECRINEECSGNLACQNEQCRDPCPGACGSFSICTVIKHKPVCSCVEGYTGDPFNGCSFIIICKIFYFQIFFLSFFLLYSLHTVPFQLLLLKDLQILATLHHAEPMPYVKKRMGQGRAHVYQNTSEIRIVDVDQNVLQILTVIEVVLVLIINA